VLSLVVCLFIIFVLLIVYLFFKMFEMYISKANRFNMLWYKIGTENGEKKNEIATLFIKIQDNFHLRDINSGFDVCYISLHS